MALSPIPMSGRLQQAIPGGYASGEDDPWLMLVLDRSSLRKHEARVGLVEDVLVEGPSKRDASVTSGRTRQNKLIHFTAPGPMPAGTFADVRVTYGAPHFLRWWPA